jgi:hypothetical protein
MERYMKNLISILCGLFIGGACWYGLTSDKQRNIDWSPCGNTNLTSTYRSNRGEQMFRYFDDGKKVWRITGIEPPVSDSTQPVVKMVQEFERSPQNCAIWKMEHGIKD